MKCLVCDNEFDIEQYNAKCPFCGANLNQIEREKEKRKRACLLIIVILILVFFLPSTLAFIAIF